MISPELIEEYKKLYGKIPFMGWSEEKVKQKLAEKGWTGSVNPEPVNQEEPRSVETTVSEVSLLYSGICDDLFCKILDGDLRRIILDMKDKEVKTNKDIITELEALKIITKDGDLKGLINQYIIKLS